MEEERKHKLDILAEDQENGEEDEKVERFFAIVRRLRDAFKYSTKSLGEQETYKAAKKAKKVHAPVWTPEFQVEDFAEPGSESTHVAQSSSLNKECDKEKKEELDLNLTL